MYQLFIESQLTMKLTMKFIRPLFALLYLVVVRFDLLNAKGIPSMSKCGKVFLTVSSLRSSYVEMNWNPNCKSGDEPDTISLYDKDPTLASRPIESVSRRNWNEGYYRTSTKFFPISLPAQWEYHENIASAKPGSHCMPFWIASTRKNKIIDKNCLMIRPTWMADNRSILGTIPIGGMIIPGTHNSGAYTGVLSILKPWLLNQEVDLWTQLVFGIRYFDLRIGYYGGKGFYVNHDLIHMGKLLPMLKHIREFSRLSPKEVIILDFHRFPYPQNFNDSMHKELVALIQKELGHLTIPSSSSYPPKGPSLNEIWATNRTIIICYANRQISRKYKWLWDPLPQQWGNKQNVEDLKGYLLDTIQNQGVTFNPNPLWALMAELTINPSIAIFAREGNRALADQVNRELTKWFREEWYKKQTNVVATDYFLGNDIINVAIEMNKLK